MTQKAVDEDGSGRKVGVIKGANHFVSHFGWCCRERCTDDLQDTLEGPRAFYQRNCSNFVTIAIDWNIQAQQISPGATSTRAFCSQCLAIAITWSLG